jgi:outer membrane protein assembly factor BamB
MRSMRNIAGLLALSSALAGCGIFGGKDDEALQPKELVDFQETLEVRRAWSAKLGGGSEFLRLSLSPAGDGERVYGASRDGVVSAFDPATGKRLWRTELKVPLSAGPGVGAGRVVVAGSDGDLVCLNAEDGSEVWRLDVVGESLSRPLVQGDSVIVYTIDGTLRVLSRFDGSERWTLDQNLPALTLRGASTPVIVGNTVIAGFDNGRLIASALTDGSARWEVMLSPPTGRSDLERLADVDGRMVAVGQDVYASGYQGRLAAVAAESGQILWAREISTHAGLNVDEDNVYVVADSGELAALSRRTGADRWRQDALLRREPTAPVIFAGAVVVGDFDGYVHFFDRRDGTPVARVRVGKGMLAGPPVVIGDRLYVQSETGRLEVFEVELEDEQEVAARSSQESAKSAAGG